jgi:4-hydroxybutyryl-CoA dehydratase/vinylacetyl-CoA-Delta-isomerase
MEYVLTQDPRYQNLFAERNEEGELVSFFYIPPRSQKDLLRRREIIQVLTRACLGLSLPQLAGSDGLNALAVVCGRMDNKLGTNYSERVEAYRKHLQKNHSATALAMTDVKGDRALRPSRQEPHKDYFVRIVEERSDGIVVKGAKTHISASPCANEMIVLPCRNMLEDDKNYAVAFAIPIDTKGVTYISSAREAIEEGNFFDYPLTASGYLNDALVVFEDVFVPMERVFMKGEWQFSGDMTYMFANFHRISGDSYKYAELEVLVGAAALMAEYNGLEKAPHVQDKLSWLVMYAEGTEAFGKIACQECITDPDSHLVYPNPMYSNITKLFFADNFHQAIKNLQDITGGIVATIPSSKDFFNPETHPLIEKYLGGKAGIPTEDRLRAINLVKDLSSVYLAGLTLHAEGSLAAQRLSIYTIGDFEKYKAAAKRAARIKDGKEHPIFAQLPSFPLSSI